MYILGVIPARGGSVRVPRKNLRIIGDWTLVQWAAECARRCSRLDRYFIFTEDYEITTLARTIGVEPIFEDPVDAAGSLVTALIHLMAAIKPVPDALVVLQPTTPFRPVYLVEQALAYLDHTTADSVVAVSEGRPTGELYVSRRETLLGGRLLGPGCQELSRSDVVINIDTEWDLVQAERYYRANTGWWCNDSIS